MSAAPAPARARRGGDRRPALRVVESEPDLLALGAAVYPLYEDELRARGRAPRTLVAYRAAAAGLARYAAVPLEDVTRDQVNAYLARTREGIGAPTEAAHYRALRAFYRWCEGADLVDKSPMRGLIAPAVTQKVTPVPHADVIRGLLDSMSGRTFDDLRDTAIIRVMCELGGPRLSEVATMQLGDWDATHRRILVRGKGDKYRLIPVSRRTALALTRYLRARRAHRNADCPTLWIGKRREGVTKSLIALMLTRRCDRAGLDRMHPHQFRHYAAAEAKRRGIPTAYANALFGWKPGSKMYDMVYGAFVDAENALALADGLAIGDEL